jgi:hypothetical protein
MSTKLTHELKSSVADLEPVGSGPFWSGSDPDLFGRIRIRIMALINDPISTFLVCVKAKDTTGASVV